MESSRFQVQRVEGLTDSAIAVESMCRYRNDASLVEHHHFSRAPLAVDRHASSETSVRERSIEDLAVVFGPDRGDQVEGLPAEACCFGILSDAYLDPV